MVLGRYGDYKEAEMRAVMIAVLGWGFVLLGSLREMQETTWKTLDFPVPPLNTSSLLIEVQVSPDSVPFLLTASKNEPPQAGFDRDGSLRVEAQTADFVAYAYKTTTGFLSLNSSELRAGGVVNVGLFIPEVPTNGADTTVTLKAHCDFHSAGEICPFDCSLNGSCLDGLCNCRDNWVGEDCSQRAVEVLINESKDVIVGERGYVVVQVTYRSSQNLGIQMKVVQGEAVLLVAYGE